jgi:hypothetical protein
MVEIGAVDSNGSSLLESKELMFLYELQICEHSKEPAVPKWHGISWHILHELVQSLVNFPILKKESRP